MDKPNSQLITIEKVLEEMQKAERIINSWNAFWWEIYEDTVLPQAYFDSPHYENEKLSIEVLKIDASTYTSQYMGLPLRHFLLGEKYSCDVCTIVWEGIMTAHSTRRIRFFNNGNIEIEKTSNKKQTKKYPRKISYYGNYNVLSEDFTISITIDTLIEEKLRKHESDNIIISLNDNILTEKFDDVEIIKNLNTGYKKVRMLKTNERKKASIIFEATLSSDDSLEKGSIMINTHKGNGKVNGTYKFDVDKEKNVQAHFYSRKGTKYILTENSELMEAANALLLAVGNQYQENFVMSSFIRFVREKMKLDFTTTGKDDTDFVRGLKQIEKHIMVTVKCIKGELPLIGFIERIDNCLVELMSKGNQLPVNNHKILQL